MKSKKLRLIGIAAFVVVLVAVGVMVWPTPKQAMARSYNYYVTVFFWDDDFEMWIQTDDVDVDFEIGGNWIEALPLANGVYFVQSGFYDDNWTARVNPFGWEYDYDPNDPAEFDDVVPPRFTDTSLDEELYFGGGNWRH